MKRCTTYRDPYKDIPRTCAWEGPFYPRPFFSRFQRVVIIFAITLAIGALIG